MKKTILVPVDFSPVSHNALRYACELALIHPTEIVAVHLLDHKLREEMAEMQEAAPEGQPAADHVHEAAIMKAEAELAGFVADLKEKFGDIIATYITPGSIYDAFNDIAARYDSSLIVMGTHGITGMQHLAGSRAYKVVINTPLPFLVVQNKRYKPIKKMYLAFRDARQMHSHAQEIATLCHYFPGDLVINVIAGDTEEIPGALHHIGHRIAVKNRRMNHVNVIASATTEGADALCISINELDNLDSDIFGMTQDRILANRHELPVLCLPQK